MAILKHSRAVELARPWGCVRQGNSRLTKRTHPLAFGAATGRKRSWLTGSDPGTPRSPTTLTAATPTARESMTRDTEGLVRGMEGDPALPERERLALGGHGHRRRAAVGELDVRAERPARLRARRDVDLVTRHRRPAQHRRAARPAREGQRSARSASTCRPPPAKTSSGPPSSLRSLGLIQATIGSPEAGKAATIAGPPLTARPPRASTAGAGRAWPAVPFDTRRTAGLRPVEATAAVGELDGAARSDREPHVVAVARAREHLVGGEAAVRTGGADPQRLHPQAVRPAVVPGQRGVPTDAGRGIEPQPAAQVADRRRDVLGTVKARLPGRRTAACTRQPARSCHAQAATAVPSAATASCGRVAECDASEIVCAAPRVPSGATIVARMRWVGR